VGAGLANLLVFPIVARLLPAESLGVWAILGSNAFLFWLADLGVYNAVERAAVARDDLRARRSVQIALLVVCVVAPLFAVISYFFTMRIPDASPVVRAQLPRAALLTLGSGMLIALGQPYRAFVTARKGIGPVATSRLVGAVVQLCVVGVGSRVPPTLFVPAIAFAAASAAELLVVLRAARRIDPELPLLPAWHGMAAAKLCLRDGAAALVANFAMMLVVRTDTLLLGAWVPLSMVASYGVAGRAVDSAYSIARQAQATLAPRLGNPETRIEALRGGTLLFVGLVGGGMAALAFCGQPILVAWAGPVAASSVTARAAVLLCLAATVSSIYEVAFATVRLGAPTPWSATIPVAAGSAVKLALSLAGARTMGWVAVAGSTVVGSAVAAALVWRNTGRLLAYGGGQLFRLLAPAVVSGLMSAATAWALSLHSHATLLFSVLASIATVAVGTGTSISFLLWGRPPLAPS
jgi:O-antigen/teichoic acid export membrane protein